METEMVTEFRRVFRRVICKSLNYYDLEMRFVSEIWKQKGSVMVGFQKQYTWRLDTCFLSN